MSGEERVCTFCGAKPASYIESSLYSCGAGDCEKELGQALRERDEMAREEADRDDYSRYR